MKQEKKRLLKVLKINKVNKRKLTLSVLFSNGEDRMLDFRKILAEDWAVQDTDPEYALYEPSLFADVTIEHNTLVWQGIKVSIMGFDKKKKEMPFSVGADTLYTLSSQPVNGGLAIGSLLRQARKKARLSQLQVAQLAGTSRTYITRLESGKQDVELMTLKKIVEAGLNKHLKISIE